MIFQRSILREKIAVFAVILFTLLTITLVLLLVRGLRDAADGAIAVDGVLRLMLIATLRYFPLIVVVTVIVAMIMTITRLYQDSEMAVWQASGLGSLSLLRPVMMLVMPMFLFLLFLNAVLTPWGNQQLAQYRTQSGMNELNLIKPGSFRTGQNGKRVFFIQDVVKSESPEFRNVFALQKTDKETLLLTAERAHLEDTFDNRTFLVLEKGRQYQDRFADDYLQSMSYGRYGFSMDEFTGIKTSDLKEPDVELLGTRELWNNPKTTAVAELYRRFSDAFMIIPMALLSVVLGFSRPRASSRTLGVLTGLVTFMIYLNLIKYGEAKLHAGAWSLDHALLVSHGVFLLLALLALWYRQNAWRYTFHWFSRRSKS
ncbi:LPS export ABC transporter permease LptF [Hydromonas duriensis]|uniref:Lipopolysaccharide export system permease protein LptF n=1 Tax=Hydromonas duriensis TaxID=1527608 RepID=A0A4R6Y8I7_9BURK|nr:LPS export ABC transporter permease LptF [Hydromonas duriensis]TDR31707.1 lipopolysaccharide export system permease protein [Hydromonas duriensis]